MNEEITTLDELEENEKITTLDDVKPSNEVEKVTKDEKSKIDLSEIEKEIENLSNPFDDPSSLVKAHRTFD